MVASPTRAQHKKSLPPDNALTTSLPHGCTPAMSNSLFTTGVMNEVQKRVCERDLFRIECTV